MNTLFDFDDFLIQPADISQITSRKDVNPFDENGFFPLITAPMDTVVGESNYNIFHENKIYPMLPRTSILSEKTNCWKAVGLKEFEEVCLNFDKYEKPAYICIDIANGHMEKLLDITTKAKEKYGESLILMVGNIANPNTYKLFSDAGADYCRIGIGNGGGCLTTQQTGIGYPMGSLIRECYSIVRSQANQKTAKIVADGGMKKYSDIIKALAVGADYVMLGSILNKALESAGETYHANIKHDNWTEPGEKVDQYCETTRLLFQAGSKFFKKFRGMSTKEVQKSWGNKTIKTSEGVTRMQPVEYTVSGWVENFEHYLRTAMSYTDSKTLKEFREKTKINMISNNAFNRFNK